MDIGERARRIISERLSIPRERLVDSATFYDDLGVDELERYELVMAFEEMFGCDIDDATVETFRTVGDAVRFLERVGRP
jgi:acyl carrier protein